MERKEYDLVIIGGGPGGYVAAIRAAQLGLKTACVESRETLGGTCLNVGCIPSKALLESSLRFHEAAHDLAGHGVQVGAVALDLPKMLKRKDELVGVITQGVASLFWKWKVDHVRGTGRLMGPGRVAVAGPGGESELACKHVILATGSVPASLPGIAWDGERIGTSTEGLAYGSVPEHLVVIGAGAIGLEIGSVWRRLGARVTVLEYLDRILPGMDLELAKAAQKSLARQGLKFKLGARVTGARAEGAGALVEVEGSAPLACSHVLVAVGRKPFSAGLGLEEAGVALDSKGRARVDEAFATNLPGVFAVGDLIRGPMLAHKAAEEGVACVERIATGHGHVNYDAIPGVVYTAPEAAGVGRTEEELAEAKVPFRKGSFPFMANGRARALGSREGFVKILAHAETDRVLGVHILGPRAGDLIAEAVAAIEFGASAEDLARTCHAHPTLAEALQEAALAVAGRARHV